MIFLPSLWVGNTSFILPGRYDALLTHRPMYGIIREIGRIIKVHDRRWTNHDLLVREMGRDDTADICGSGRTEELMGTALK